MPSCCSLLLVLVSVVPSALAGAYPLPPRGLGTLYEEAQLVVVATVESEVVNEWGERLVTLSVQETWKGERRATVATSYVPGGCPASPRYPVGRTVLAFLEPYESDAGWSTVGWSYGSKLLSQPALARYRERVEALREVLALDDADERERRRVSWALDGTAHETTRLEGLLDLGGARLGWDEQERLVEVLRSDPGSAYALHVMVLLEDLTGDAVLAGLRSQVASIPNSLLDLQERARREDLVGAFDLAWRELAGR